MIGTTINAVAIIVGGALGLLIKRFIPKEIEKPLFKVQGLSVLLIALMGFFKITLTVVDGSIVTNGELLLIISLIIGVIIGELLKIDDRLNKGAKKIEGILKIEGFSEGFVSSALVFAVGALAILGPMDEVLRGDMTLLSVKSIIDGIMALLLAATLGFGVIASAVPVFLVQGAVALFAGVMSDVPMSAINEVCMVGYAIVMCIGLNFALDFKFKTANVLPALLIPIVYNLLKTFFI